MKNRSIFDLGNDILTKCLAPKLRLKELVTLSTASSSLGLLFKKPLDDRVNKQLLLLEAVKMANYSKVITIINTDLDLIFYGSVEYAFKVYDHHLYEIFWNAVQETGEQALLNRFLHQMNRPINYINLYPLFAAYDHYLKQYTRYTQNQLSKLELNEAWLELGMMQCTLLPWYMIKIGCDMRKRQWHSRSSFVLSIGEEPNEVCQIASGKYDKDNNKEMITLNPEKWGVEFTLLRGLEENYPIALSLNNYQGPLRGVEVNAQLDKLAWMRLLEVNIAKLRDFKNQLMMNQEVLVRRGDVLTNSGRGMLI